MRQGLRAQVETLRFARQAASGYEHLSRVVEDLAANRRGMQARRKSNRRVIG